MNRIPLLVITAIIVWAIVVALLKGEAAGIPRRAKPAAYWSMISLSIAGACATTIAALAE